jgi:hypothetical protein
MYLKIQMEYFYEELLHIKKYHIHTHVDRYSKNRDEENPHT